MVQQIREELGEDLHNAMVVKLLLSVHKLIVDYPISEQEKIRVQLLDDILKYKCEQLERGLTDYFGVGGCGLSVQADSFTRRHSVRNLSRSLDRDETTYSASLPCVPVIPCSQAEAAPVLPVARSRIFLVYLKDVLNALLVTLTFTYR